MKNVILTIDGVEIPVQISQSKAEKLTKKPIRTGYERVEKGEKYCCTHLEGSLETYIEDYGQSDAICYEIANYTNDETLEKKQRKSG